MRLFYEGLALIDSKNYDEAMSLLKESQIKRGRFQITESGSPLISDIEEALEKCSPNKPDVMS